MSETELNPDEVALDNSSTGYTAKVQSEFLPVMSFFGVTATGTILSV